MSDKIPSTPEAWEDGPLGKDVAHARDYQSPKEEESLIDEAFGLKAISIRLEVELIDNLKAIAKHYGMGYQPLMRQQLHRFVDSELKRIALEKLNSDETKEHKIDFAPQQKKAA